MTAQSITTKTTTTKTTCPYCGVGCGVDITRDQSGAISVKGDTTHPANFGKLCVKGSALGETLGLEDRLLYPMIHGQRSTWNQATGFIAKGLEQTIAKHGTDAVAFYLSGQLLTEDYYVANKFAKGFLGTPHVDTNSRLCMASSVAGHRRAFGSDTVPNSYDDLDAADLIILVGSNAAWCHPVLFQRMQIARETRGTIIINIDPRRTATSEGADLQLTIRPGMDSVLFAWLLVQIHEQNHHDVSYVSANTSGFENALKAALNISPDIETVVNRTGLQKADIERFVELFLKTEKVVTCYSQGVNQSAQGSDKVNAILNCHLATARIGKVGCGPLSLTGQPNAMGGREVGGLANMLAAHMGFTPEERNRVQRFWEAPNLIQGEGLKAIQMFEAIEQGKIKALWVMHTNPAVTLPRADAMRSALKKLDLFVVSEAIASTDTTAAGAHVLLPAAAWGEKNGTVTNSERRISRQRAFLKAPVEAKPDWQHITLVAQRMGFKDGFNFENEAAIYREHAALSAFENDGSRDFDIGETANYTDLAYDNMQPFLWPYRKGHSPQERFFADGQFYTADKRARFISIADPALAVAISGEFPFVLNTGRVRDHWHTMTRTGKAIRLARHISEAMLTIHPDDAKALQLKENGFVRIDSAHGAASLRVGFDNGLPLGHVFAPFHWNNANSALARVDAIVQSQSDPVSGQPELKATPVRLSPLTMQTEGFLVSRKKIILPEWLQHSRFTIASGEAIVFASTQSPQSIFSLLSNLLGEIPRKAELNDEAGGDFRMVGYDAARLECALYVQSKRDTIALDWLIENLSKTDLTLIEQASVLAGVSADGNGDLGPLICSCFAIRESEIRAAVENGKVSVDAIGEILKAGTNCGSCRPEIKRVIGNVLESRPEEIAA
jgi:assimilatory nitrate reductase catalytic subunit